MWVLELSINCQSDVNMMEIPIKTKGSGITKQFAPRKKTYNNDSN